MRIVAGLLALLIPAAASAQTRTWVPEISVSTGLGHVFRWEDQTFGDRWNAGGNVRIIRDSKWALEVHGDRTFDLEPRRTPCGLVGVTCVGVAHDGPRSISVVSISAQYRFTGRRVQPYLIAGLGMMRSRSLHSLTQVQGPIALVTESESSDRGFGPDVGAGLRVPVGRSWSLNPEVRWLDAPWLSRENLAVTRLVLEVAYSVR